MYDESNPPHHHHHHLIQEVIYVIETCGVNLIKLF